MSKEWANAQLAKITSGTLGLEWEECLFDAVIAWIRNRHFNA